MNSLAFALFVAALAASVAIGEAANDTTPVADGACSIAEMEHLNTVLQAVTGGYPPECAALRDLAPENITKAMCEDDGCKQWVNGTLLLRNCGNPALNSWQEIASKRLSECQILEPGPDEVGSEEITTVPSVQANETNNTSPVPRSKTAGVVKIKAPSPMVLASMSAIMILF